MAVLSVGRKRDAEKPETSREGLACYRRRLRAGNVKPTRKSYRTQRERWLFSLLVRVSPVAPPSARKLQIFRERDLLPPSFTGDTFHGTGVWKTTGSFHEGEQKSNSRNCVTLFMLPRCRQMELLYAFLKLLAGRREMLRYTLKREQDVGFDTRRGEIALLCIEYETFCTSTHRK